MALPFRIAKRAVSRLSSLRNFIKRTNTAVADIYRNGFFDNASPSVALNSPADAGTTSDTTPTLDFTGTDAEGNDVRFNLQLCNDNLFLPIAPEIRASSQNSAATGSPNVSAPAGAQVGDKMIVVVAVNGQTTIADNNGGTPFDEDINDYKPNTSSGHTISVFSRIIQAGDPTTYNFTPGTTGRWAAIATCLKGGAYDVAPSTGNAANDDSASSGTINAPSITVGNNSIHIVVCNWDTSAIGTITTPSGYTLIQNANGGGNPLHASYKSFASGGTTGAVTCDNTEFGAMIAFSFSVKSKTTILLDKVSGTDSGFANPDNGGDTDPFNSGENIQYTVQAGDALAVGTYYWRVRAMDPSGSNSYGAWSSIRSFDVTSGGGSYSQICTDTLSITDIILRKPGRILLDTTSIADLILKRPSRILSESVSIADSIRKSISRVITESQGISDAVVKIFSRVFSDSTSVSDSSNQAKVTLKVVSDSVSVTDSVTKLSSKVFGEVISVADTIVRRATRILSDTVGVVDSVRRSIARIFLDSIGASDIIRKTTARTLSENTTAADSIQKKATKVISNTVNITDSSSLSRAIQRVMSDVVSVSDSVSRSIGRTLLETISVADSIVGAIIRGVSKFIGILRSVYPINTTIKANAKYFLLNSKNTAITLKNNGRGGVMQKNNNQFTQKL